MDIGTPARTGVTRWTIARWALLTLFVAGIIAAHLWYGNRHRFFDLGIYADGVDWWLAGHDLYEFSRPDATQGSLGFTYPPFGALVLVPFGALPWGGTVALYCALAVAAFGITTHWLVTPVARRHGWPRWFVLVLALAVVSALEPIRETVTFGQINPLIVLLVLADLLFLVPLAARRGNAKLAGAAGALIGIAAAIKLTPAIFVVYLLISGRRRAALTAIASAATATLLAAVIAPRASWTFWTEALWRGEGLGNSSYTPNQSILGLLARLAWPGEPSTVLWAALVLPAVGYGLWRARRAALNGDELTGLTITGLVGCLASPVTWAHHLYWFVPALVILVDRAASPGVDQPSAAARRIRAGSGVLAVVLALTVSTGMISWFELGLPEDPWDAGLTGFFIRNAYLLLVAVLILVLPIRAYLADEGRVDQVDRARPPAELQPAVR